MEEKISIEDMATFCKKKGFVFQNSEIYGGMAGFFDYGPLGVELKNNIKSQFWNVFVQQREDVVGIDGTTITHPKVWEASGHVDSFLDYIYKCPKCRIMVKGDDDKGMTCPKCEAKLKSSGKLNLMFTTNVGPVEGNISYLRPETAQVIFTNYKLVQETSRKKLPFGIAQTGKAFRNEISPRDFLFRSREFEQFEIEYFINPKDVNNCPFIKEVESMKLNLITEKEQKANKPHSEITIDQMVTKRIASPWHAYWLAKYYKFFLDLGIKKENLRLREHHKDELAHYASACFDIEYNFPFGWKEIHGNADRQQFDLTQHMKFSNTSMEYFDEEAKEKVIPYVASEPSQGIDRAFLTFIFEAYNDDKKRGNVVLKLHPKLAPIKVGIFPLVNKLEKEAKKLFTDLSEEFNSMFDKSGSVGRRYARADEIGIPFCITFDFDSLKDKKVTIRDRDTTKQVRTPIKDLKETLRELLNK
ncbi:MAG: glycine--tRNA ligase [Candidatus Woesearchaeota archaeon]|jgi:glycyl-tRNA synthetase|nr:glycine--tRNA ligase [Candidatus Woesearchaeota archaeon]